MMNENSTFLSSETLELSETSTYLTLRNRLCYYGEPNLNNVCLPVEGALEKAETLVGMPVVAKYKVDSQGNPDLGGHEMTVDPITHEVKFGTENIGVHEAVEIKDDLVQVNGVTKRLPCLFANLRIWARNKNMVAAIKRLYEEGKLTNSWELISSAYKFENGIKTLEDYCFEAVALLGSAVRPAYDGCASTLSVASANSDPEIIIAEALAKDVAARAEEEKMSKPTEQTNSVVETTPTDTAPVSEVDQADNSEAQNEEECASLTENDLRDRIREACRAKLGKWCWIAWHFPVDKVVWLEVEYRESELDYVMFTYDVIDNEVVVGEPTDVKLAVSVRDINDELESKTNALLDASEQINTLTTKLAELNQYKEEKEAAELEVRRGNLKAYALKSRFISESETVGDSEIAAMIQNVDEAGIKNVIAERFMKSLETAKPITASTEQNDPETLSASIEDDDASNKSFAVVKAFLNKKSNF